MNQEKRLGVIAIVVEDPRAVHNSLNDLISDASELVVGRMGIPYRERNAAVIALAVDATEDQINSLTGKLGKLPGVNARAAMTKTNPAPGER